MQLEVTLVDSFKFDADELLQRHFDKSVEGKRLLWRDSDKSMLKLKKGVLTKDCLLVFSEINCYKVTKNRIGKFTKGQVQIIPEICWKNFYIGEDMKNVYLIMNQANQLQTGLSHFDLTRILDEKAKTGKNYEDFTMWLQFAQIGIQSQIDYGIKIERIGYLKSYSEIVLVPTLHLNQMTLIGQKYYKQYIAVSQRQDAFYALYNEAQAQDNHSMFQMKADQAGRGDNRGQEKTREVTKLSTWDILTGKLMLDIPIPQDFSGYESFKANREESSFMSGLYDFTLLVSKEPLPHEESRIAQHFEKEQLEQKFPRQKVYVESENDAKNFHTFKMIRIVDGTHIKEEFQFEHPKYVDEQYLYFNKRCDLMIEWLSHNRVLLYQRQDLGDFGAKDNSQDKVLNVEWKLIRRMKHLNRNYGRKDFLEFVSQDFTAFIDVDLPRKQFMIRDMFTEAQIEDDIPHYLMTYDRDPEEAVLKFRWVGNDAFKIISKTGMEKLISVNSDFPQEQFNQVQNYDDEEERHRNWYFDRKPLTKTDVTERLIRKTQMYKSVTNMYQKEVNDQRPLNLYEYMFTLDYQASTLLTKKFFSDLSFSFITWRTIEQLKNREIPVEKLDDETIKQLTFTILPGGSTIFHELCADTETMDYILSKTLAGKGADYSDVQYTFPYLQNFKDECPMTLCVDNDLVKTANLLLKYMSGLGIDHHSRLLSKFLPNLLSFELANFVSYMESRNQQTDLIMQYTRREINPDNKTKGIMVTDFWTEEKEIEAALFTPSQKGQDIQLQYMDIADIHEFSQIGQEFFSTMSETPMLELFDLEIVRNLILFKWPLVKEHIITWLFMPFLVQLATTVYYTGYLLHAQLNNEAQDWLFVYVIELIILVLALYFFGLEMLQLKIVGIYYFASIWNYIDFIPPFIQVQVVLLTFNGYFQEFPDNEQGKHSKEFVSVLHSIASLCLWFRFLYFLRIFDTTGFLIRAILGVVVDMRYFLLVLMITFAGFGDAFKVMSLANENADDQYVGGGFFHALFYTYLIGLGEFGLDNFGQVGIAFCYFLFILNTLFTTIIMLNLFIAIISDSFASINQQGVQASFREKAGLIAENLFLIRPEA